MGDQILGMHLIFQQSTVREAETIVSSVTVSTINLILIIDDRKSTMMQHNNDAILIQYYL